MIEAIENFFITIWESIIFIVYMLVMLVSIPFSGFENKVIKNCVPNLEYISTSRTVFVLNSYMDKILASRGYDPLNLLNTNEYYFDIKEKRKYLSVGEKDPLDYLAFPKGTVLKLTGEILDRQPQGIVKTNNSRMIYLKAIVLDYIVWFPMYQLDYFNNSDLDSNIENNKLIHLPEKWSDREKWVCPL